MIKKLLIPTIAFAFLFCTSANTSAQEGFIGEIKLVGFNFSPRGWAECNGQLLPISQNQALFSLLGTIYGGDGRTTFALPDLRGRVPVGVGQGPGLKNVMQGERSNGDKVPLTKVAEDPSTTTIPHLGIRYVICLQGIFPSRN